MHTALRPRLARAPRLALLALCACGGSTGGDAGTDSPRPADGAPLSDAPASPDGAPPLDAPATPDATSPPDAPAVPDGATPPPPTACAPLPPPTGAVVRVTPARAGELAGLVASAGNGTTILLEDGTYALPAGTQLNFRTPRVTLRSASNNAAAVVIDGQYTTNEIIAISASEVTIAHVTVTRAVDHPIHIYPPAGPTGIERHVLYGLRVVDGGEQFVKVNGNGTATAWVDNGRIECSVFQMTDAGRPRVERASGGCYTGGIDVHAGRGWQVRANRFEGIYCAGEGLAEHAIHFWVGARDTLVENNTIVDCARGIGFGLIESGATRMYPDNPYPGVGFIGHYDGIIRNNVIWATHRFYDTGIELAQARGTRVYHNTVLHAATATGAFSSIDYRFGNTQVDIRNNLTARITQRNGAMGRVESNLQMTPLAYLANPAMGDFHLTAGATEAIDRGVVVDGAGLDLDGQMRSRGAAPDLGADEFGM